MLKGVIYAGAKYEALVQIVHSSSSSDSSSSSSNSSNSSSSSCSSSNSSSSSSSDGSSKCEALGLKLSTRFQCIKIMHCSA